MKRSLLLLTILLTLASSQALAQEILELRHTHYRLNVRAGAGLGYSVLGTVTPCDELHVIRVWDRWYQILFGEGSGFVAGWYTAAGEPHCPGQTTSPVSSGAGTTEASGGQTGGTSDGGGQTLDTFTGNKCYGEWDCGPGNTPESLFMWKTGWCAATIDADVASWTLQQCQAGLGLVPGQPSAPATTASGTSGGGSSGGSGSGSGGGSGGDTGGDTGGGGGGGGGSCNHDTHVWDPAAGRCVPHVGG